MATNKTVPFRVFDSKEENFEIFVQRFEAACEANETSDQKKVVILLSLLNSELLKLGNDLFYPEKIKEQSYEAIIKNIRQHLEPKPKVIPQRCKFLKRVQKETETISEYLRELKHLATNCEFVSLLEMMLRDIFVAGLSSEALQKRLLQEDDDLKLDRVLAIAVSYELAEMDASELHGNCIGKVTSHSERNRRERHTPVQKYSPTAGVKWCYRCGERNSHLAPACPRKSKACYKCKKIWHLSKVCKAPNYALKNSYVHEQILSLKGETEAKVTLTLDGNVLKCEVDTGSPVELAEAKGVVNINTTKGLFAYKRLPYGVAVAPNKFQRLMDNIFADIPGVACYIDNILMSGRDANEHKAKLELVFKRLEDKGLILNKNKCRFAVDSVEYLGFRIDKNGLHPLINKIQAVSNAPEPKNIGHLRSYIGMQYLLGRSFVLVTDNRPLMHLFSPHKPIPVCAASRIKRWSLKLGAFHYSVEFRKTDDHGNADSLSRLPLKAVERESIDEEQVLLLRKMNKMPFSFRDVAFETIRDKILSIVLRNVREDNWQIPNISKENSLFPFYKIRNELSVDFGCLQWRERIVIPPKLRSQILRDLHEMHFGIVKMKIIARRYFWWPGIDGNIEDMARECTICQESANMPPSTISDRTWPEKPWHRLHMDLAGPFMGRMFLVIVDAYTKWLEIFILKEITSKTIIYHLRQVFARFGLPELLVTDNGRQFVSKEFEEFTKMNGIRHTITSPYNPSTNGLAERYVREFKTSLRKNCGKDGLETNLERFLMAQRAFPQRVMKESLAELLMKRRLKTRFSNLMPKMEFKGEVFHDALKKQENFNIGSDVYFRNYAVGPKWKQGTILKLLSCRHYLIGYEDQSFKRHINQLRPVKEKPEATVLKDPRLILPSTSTETLENHPEMKPSQVGLEIPESKLPDMELAEKPKSTGQDLAPVEGNQSPVAASGEKVPSRSPRPQREKPRLTRQNLAPVGANQSPVVASGGEVPSRSPRPQQSRRPPDRFHRRVEAKTSFQDDDVPIDDNMTTKPPFSRKKRTLSNRERLSGRGEFSSTSLHLGRPLTGLTEYRQSWSRQSEKLGNVHTKNEDTVALRKFREQIKVELGAKAGDRSVLTGLQVDEVDLGFNTLEQRAVIRFLNAEGIQTSQICQRMKNIYGFEVLEHPAYSPDLAPSDFFLFGLLKKELKGKRFDSDEDVQKVVQDSFHTLPKSAYKEGIYKLPERWRRCIESQGDYFE
ncbi:K02A2.6-like [Cordylochernes scorpioides]|uniref:RNA-directed DNA polymerase n=1 Tax=Cordylochernes scorpioides TaxID=51811 RepID=A0ABY6KCT2_9ARAC|nr:K02A2.6-like [Cordylochernes scorpioides]